MRKHKCLTKLCFVFKGEKATKNYFSFIFFKNIAFDIDFAFVLAFNIAFWKKEESLWLGQSFA